MSKGSQSKPVRNEFLFRTVTVQFIICLLFIGALLFIKSSSPDTFRSLQNKFNALMKRDITFEEMASAVKSVSAAEKSPKQSADVKDKSEDVTDKADKTEASGGEDLLKAQDKTTFSPVVVSDNLVSPLEEYTLTSKFGYRENPISGKYGFHTGLDMAADEGTEIRAAYDGIVIETGFTEVRGNYVIIEHSDNTETGYYHCKRILCDIDQNVRKGQTIALVGSTGWSTGPHLHFEVKINGINCNPEYLLNENTD